MSGVEASSLSAKVDRHNARLGSRWQRAVQFGLAVYLLGPLLYLAIRLGFRIRVRGMARLQDGVGTHALYAVRHYYEWDPLLTFYAGLWVHALRRPHLCALTLAGPYWTRTPLRRLGSWLTGTMGMLRGLGPGQAAIDRVTRLLGSSRALTVAIFPTGPIGTDTEYEVGPSVAYLALQNPDVPVLPITLKGPETFRPGSVLRLRRPQIDIAFCRPFYGRDFVSGTFAERVKRICHEVRQRWTEAESAGPGE